MSGGLYTVPVGDNGKLRPGVAKLQFKPTNAAVRKACQLIFKSNRLWDRLCKPAIERALKLKGIKNIRLPSSNFYANAKGNLKKAPLTPVPAGYKFYLRKGYDSKTGIAFIRIVVY